MACDRLPMPQCLPKPPRRAAVRSRAMDFQTLHDYPMEFPRIGEELPCRKDCLSACEVGDWVAVRDVPQWSPRSIRHSFKPAGAGDHAKLRGHWTFMRGLRWEDDEQVLVWVRF